MIAAVEFRNWMCFRGEHRIDLRGLAYSLYAHRVDDPMRSNWSGKSALLESIRFGVTGKIDSQRITFADDWITRGEDDGYVKVTFEGGAWVKRSRTRGQSTKVEAHGFEQGKAVQDQADLAIARWLGWSDTEFLSTAYFPQREVARFILATSSERFRVVTGWFGLAPLERAATTAGKIAAEHAADLEKISQRKRQLEEQIDQLTSEVDLGALTKAMQEADAHVAELEKDLELATTRDRYEEAANDYKLAVEKGKRLKAAVDDDELGGRLAKNVKEAEQVLAALTLDAEEKRKEAKRRLTVSKGEFDGKCPVADIECPATKRINNDRKASKEAYDEANAKAETAEGALEVARKRTRNVLVERDAAAQRKIEIDTHRKHTQTLLERAKALREKLGDAEIAETSEIQEALTVARASAREAQQVRANAQANARQLDGVEGQLLSIQEPLAEADALSRLASRARAVFRTAHRNVAEGALKPITAAANAGLADIGTDLRVDVSWEREGGDLAKACDQCGSAFPASKRVKACPRCEAPRGRNMIQELEFTQTDRSGAADDLAGLEFQIAAGSYFLRSRHSPWATCLLDEPFGQLDPFHRRALARHLAAMITSKYAYRQAIVIAHDASVLDVFPARIEVIAGPKGSTVKVVTP